MPATATTSALPPGLYGELVKLSQQGKLSGVPPQILDAIFQAEGSNTSGAINSQGAGGYYGLVQGSTYTFGNNSYPITQTNLSGTSTPDFRLQSQAAGAAFASYLAASNGNVYQAENEYQTGDPNKASDGSLTVFPARGIPQTLSGWSPAQLDQGQAVEGSTIGNNAVTKAVGSASKAVSSAVTSVLPTSWETKLKGGLLMAAGAVGILVGLGLLFKAEMTKALLGGLLPTTSRPSSSGSSSSGSSSSSPSSEDQSVRLDAAFAEGFNRGQRELQGSRRSVPARGEGPEDF